MLAAETHTAPEELLSRLDSAVSEVFETMLERSCAPVTSQHAAGDQITARIQFSGSIEGLCILYATPQVAQLTAEASAPSPIPAIPWSMTPSANYAT